MTRFEILIELNNLRYNLDLFQEESIEVNYNIADINDISSRNSSYTKTVTIPETSLNRQIFGDIADLSVSSTFNPNLKTKCWVLVDTVVVLDGYLQLRNVKDDIDLGGRVYEIVIFAENDNFVKELQELELTDLDFSELSHTYSSTNITTSWTQSWNWGYYYPLIDYGFDWDYTDISGTKFGRNDVEVGDMYPATNVKYILDKIFAAADYSYQSDFLNSNVFRDLYVPYNRDVLKKDISGLDDKFAVALTTPQTFTNSFVPFVSTINLDIPQFLGLYRIPFNNESVPYGDPDGLYDTTNYEFVAGSSFPQSRFVCDFDISFLYLGDTDFDYIYGNSTNPQTAFIPANSICFRRSKNPATGQDVVGGVVIPVNGSNVPTPFLVDSISNLEITGPGVSIGLTATRVKGQISTDLLDDTTVERTRLYPGEKVWVEVRYSCSGRELLNLIGVGNNIITLNLGNVFYNILTDNLSAGEFIDYNFTVVPKNIKQLDFFTSLIKMFNLYVEPSKENDRTLLIEPREQFYEGGEIVDWTYKLDIGTPLDIKILAETQNKKTTFTYKEDKDYYNTDYKDFRAGRIYGQFEYDIDNDFVTGEKKVELIFSPTPVVQVPSSNKLVIPKIGKIQNNLFSPTEHNIRILTKFRSSTSTTWNYTSVSSHTSTTIWNGYLKLTGAVSHNFVVGDCIYINSPQVDNTEPIFKVVEVSSTTSIVVNIIYINYTGPTTGLVTPLEGLLPTDNGLELWAFNEDRWRAYPYLGHFNNPFEPNYDINYGQTTGLYYPETSVTNDNLFSVYWQNQMTELSDKDSKIITGDFYLTPDDIASFRFNLKVFLINQYYKVNKITYNPVENGLSRVELIKSLIVTVPREFSITNPSVPNSATFSNNSVPPIKQNDPTSVLISGGGNIIRKNRSLVVGSENQSYGQNTYLLGNNNVVSSNGNFVLGDGNRVEILSDNNQIIGSNNTLGAGVSGTLVFGNEVTAELPNSVYMLGRFVNLANYISGSRNEVQNAFPDVKIDYTNASRDVVRELGADSIISYINGGRFIITN
jgi:hypothetical protein